MGESESGFLDSKTDTAFHYPNPKTVLGIRDLERKDSKRILLADGIQDKKTAVIL